MRRHALLAAFALLAFSYPAQATFTEEFRFDSQSLKVGSLIGLIQVEGHSGSGFVVEVTVDGDDAERDLIEFEQRDGDRAELIVLFPTEDHSRYVYPRLGRSRSRIQMKGRRGGNWLEDLLRHRGTVEVRGGGRGLEMWSDITIKVPSGGSLEVFSGVGAAEVEGVEGELSVMLKSGGIDVIDISGDTILDTGSGHVMARNVQGSLSIDTGSGNVEVSVVKGPDLRVDTGSGHVELADCESDNIDIDTGSGAVVVEDITCEDLRVDTGSGAVRTAAVQSGSVEVDTGSGAVVLDLLQTGDGPYRVDTGSGSVNINLPSEASVDVRASTGSGRIRLEVDDADIVRQKKGYVELAMGDGDAQVELDTGSGSIRIRQR